MKKIYKLGILGASEIAFRRFLPALTKHKYLDYAGIASRYPTKAKPFQDTYGGTIYQSYDALLDDPTIDVVYIPLPPALHYEWAKKALQKGKHVLLEKPFTTKLSDTMELINLAKNKDLALHENYMFLFHKQLKVIQDLLQQKIIGEIREYRMDFGFPKRDENDFRYNKELGGGALLDCGGYPIKLATILLGETTAISYSSLKYPQGYNIDLYGIAILENKLGDIAKISFGMDNAYKCDLEIWGSLGTIKTDRIFTAPDNFSPTIIIKKGNEEDRISVECDDQFYNSIDFFHQCIDDADKRQQNYQMIQKQSFLIEHILNK